MRALVYGFVKAIVAVIAIGALIIVAAVLLGVAVGLAFLVSHLVSR